MPLPTSPPQVPDPSIPFDTPEGVATWNDYFVRVNAFISNINNVTTVTPPAGVGQFPTPYDFGAKGDGIANDGPSLQKWLDAIAGKVGYWKAGQFMSGQTLYPWSNTTIWGAGRNKAVVFPNPAINPANYPLIINHGVLTGTDDYTIAIYGVSFKGSDTIPVKRNGDPVLGSLEGFVEFVNVHDLTMQDCEFGPRRGSLVLGGGANGVTGWTMRNNTFHDWGAKDGPFPTPGTYEGGCALQNTSNTCDTAHWEDNLFYDGQWIACWMGQLNYSVVTGNIIQRCHEAGLVGGTPYGTVSNNTVSGVRLKDISDHGWECEAIYNMVAGNNVFIDCDGSCAYFTDCINVTITNSLFAEPNQIGCRVPPNPFCNGAVSLRNSSAVNAGTCLQNFTMTGCQMTGRDGNGFAAVLVYNQSVTQPMTNVSITNNNFGPPGGWAANPIQFESANTAVPANLDDTFIHRNNNGDPDAEPCTISFILDGTSPTRSKIGGVPFRPSRIEFDAVLNSGSSVSAASTGYVGYTVGWDVATQTITSARAIINNANAWATDGINFYSANSAGTACINLVNPDGISGNFCVAQIAALADILPDGFVLTLLIIPAGTSIINATCYP